MDAYILNAVLQKGGSICIIKDVVGGKSCCLPGSKVNAMQKEMQGNRRNNCQPPAVLPFDHAEPLRVAVCFVMMPSAPHPLPARKLSDTQSSPLPASSPAGLACLTVQVFIPQALAGTFPRPSVQPWLFRKCVSKACTLISYNI